MLEGHCRCKPTEKFAKPVTFVSIRKAPRITIFLPESTYSKHGYTTNIIIRGQFKCDGTRAETRFGLPVKRTSPFKSVGASVQSTTGSRGVRISGSNAGYTMFRGSVKSTGYQLHSPVSPSLPLPCVTVCHHISTGVYYTTYQAETKQFYFEI